MLAIIKRLSTIRAGIISLFTRLSQPISSPTIFFLGGLTFVFYILIAGFFLSPGAIWSPDEGAKLLQLLSLSSEGGELFSNIHYAGQKLDPSLEFALSNPHRDLLRVVDGKLVFERLPIFTLLSLPFYRWLGFLGLYVIPAFAGVAACILAMFLIGRGERRLSIFLLIAFGSPVLIYATIYWEHTLATSLGLGGALALFGIQKGAASPARKLALACLGVVLLSAAIYLRQEIVLFAAALIAGGWFVWKENRRLFLLSAILLVILLLPYPTIHRTLFAGEGLPLNARYLNLPFAYLKGAQWGAVPDLLVGPPEDEGVDSGWLGGLWSIVAVLAVTQCFSTDRTSKRLERVGLGISAILAVYFLFTNTPYRAAHGLLLSTPWALLGLTRGPEVWRTGDQRGRVIVLTTFLGLGAYALAMLVFRGSSPHGGLEWGARFALTFFPLLAIIAAWDWRKKPLIDLIIIAALILAGMGYQVRGLLTIRHDKQIAAELNQTLVALPEEHIITDLWWLLLNAAPIHGQKAFYAAAESERIAEWVDLSNRESVKSFGLVTLNPELFFLVRAQLKPGELILKELIHVDNLFIYRLEVR